MEAGKIAQKMEPVELSGIIKKIMDFMKPEAEKRGIVIESRLPDLLPLIQADKRDMEKLFTNLITNAIKYNVENGSVVVGGDVEGSYVCYRVKDSGIGIAPENLSHIFEDFFRVDHEGATKIPGTGLGLTIAKKLLTLIMDTSKWIVNREKGALFLSVSRI